jgi:hypothetical protein
MKQWHWVVDLMQQREIPDTEKDQHWQNARDRQVREKARRASDDVTVRTSLEERPTFRQRSTTPSSR